jgi:hypothetical protein
MAAIRDPNFFIVGAARAGTTSLWHWLRQHPDVFMPRDKEPHFFCESNRPQWAATTLDDYRKLFARARRETAIGEASTGYLGSLEAPHAIRRRYPDARIVIALREPVERIHSLYRFNCALGVEWASTFERALRIEDQRAASARFSRENPYFVAAYLYFRTGFVADNIARFQEIFSPDRIHFVVFDDLRRDPAGTMTSLCRFLGVDPDARIDFEAQNPSAFPYSVRLHHRLYKTAKGRPVGAQKTLGQKWMEVAWYGNLLLGTAFRSAKLDSGLRAGLAAKYHDDICKTMGLSGCDLRRWLGHANRNEREAGAHADAQPAQS